MAYETIRLYRERRYSLDRDTVTGGAVLAVARDRGAVSYEDHYRISEAELAQFLADDDALAAFAAKGEYGLRDRKIHFGQSGDGRPEHDDARA